MDNLLKNSVNNIMCLKRVWGSNYYLILLLLLLISGIGLYVLIGMILNISR